MNIFRRSPLITMKLCKLFCYVDYDGVVSEFCSTGVLCCMMDSSFRKSNGGLISVTLSPSNLQKQIWLIVCFVVGAQIYPI